VTDEEDQHKGNRTDIGDTNIYFFDESCTGSLSSTECAVMTVSSTFFTNVRKDSNGSLSLLLKMYQLE